MKIYLPENLDLESTIIGYQKKYNEKYQWIIHTIVSQNYKIKAGLGDYVNLDQTMLRRYTGERYCKEILNQLQDSGIIKINKKYSANNFCMSYKLTEKYSTSSIKSIEFNGDTAYKYIYKVNCFNKVSLAEPLKNKAIAQLYKNIFQIDIDTQAALDCIEELYNSGEINIEQYTVGLMSIENISNKDENYFFTVHKPTGRVYHSIANCPRYIRPFLTYKGEKLVQIDIANSQPMLFYKMILDYLELMRAKKAYLLSSSTTYTYDINNSNSIVYPYVETVPENSYPADVVRYMKLCSTGGFYEDLMREFNIPLSDSTRQQFKTTFFEQIFYGKVNSNWESAMAKKFKSIYPTVYNAVMWYKKDNHADLPIKLQKVESDIVIKGVCGRIVQENNTDSMPFFCTVHDCIVCLGKDVDYIENILKEELKAVMEFIPKVKTSAFK